MESYIANWYSDRGLWKSEIMTKTDEIVVAYVASSSQSVARARRIELLARARKGDFDAKADRIRRELRDQI